MPGKLRAALHPRGQQLDFIRRQLLARLHRRHQVVLLRRRDARNWSWNGRKRTEAKYTILIPPQFNATDPEVQSAVEPFFVPLIYTREVMGGSKEASGMSSSPRTSKLEGMPAFFSFSFGIESGTERTVQCDAVCLGHGFTPRLELAIAAGCGLSRDRSVVSLADVVGSVTTGTM
jgi:hypothetical protein